MTHYSTGKLAERQRAVGVNDIETMMDGLVVASSRKPREVAHPCP